jgi:microcystin-dependent protein
MATRSDFMKTLTAVLEDALAITFPEDTTNGTDGDDWSAASFEPAVQRLLNRIALLKERAAPLGSVLSWAGNVAAVPTRYLLCNGQAVSRTTYATLFAAIGTTFGGEDSSTTFNVPDLRDKFVMGASTGNVVGSNGGANAVTLTETQLPSHTHATTLTDAGAYTPTVTLGDTGLSGSGTTATDGAHGHYNVGSLSAGGSGYYGIHIIQVDGNDDWIGTVANSTGIFSSPPPAGAALAYGTPSAGSSHNHSFSFMIPDHTHTVGVSATPDHTHTATVTAVGGGQAHENRPAFVALAYIMLAL